jgi:hypothetical protein
MGKAMNKTKNVSCDLDTTECNDPKSLHYFWFHMTQDEFESLFGPFHEKVPKYKFNMIRKSLENDPMPGNTVWVGERPND